MHRTEAAGTVYKSVGGCGCIHVRKRLAVRYISQFDTRLARPFRSSPQVAECKKVGWSHQGEEQRNQTDDVTWGKLLLWTGLEGAVSVL